MQVEDVSREGFAARRATKQQGDLAVRNGLLGEVVVDDQGVLAAVAEPLTHGAAGIRCDELHGRRRGGRGRHDDGVIHRIVLFELAHNVCDRRHLLADGHVDAGEVLAFLVDDRVDGDRGLADLLVADDQFALATTNRDHRVDRLQASLYRLIDRLTSDDAGRDLLDGVRLGRVKGALAVDGVAECVDDATHELATDRDFEDPARASSRLTFRKDTVVTEDHRTDRVTL